MAFRYTGPLSPKQIRFLECFKVCSSVTLAARWAKCTRQAHHLWTKESPEYKAAFEEAEIIAARVLEDEAVRRAHEGVKKAIRYKGKIVGYEHEYSDTLMALMLKGALPKKYRERPPVDDTLPGGASPAAAAVIIQTIMQELADAPIEIRNRLGRRLMALSAPTD